MKIVVTQSDIDEGNPVSSYSCPIALAARRSGFARATVTAREIFFGKNVENKVKLPSKAVTFIRRFDKREKVRPFEFEINTK